MLKKILTCFLFLLFVTAFANSKDKAESYKIGDKVSDFTINNYDGATYTLSNSGAKATVLIFVSTECPNVQPYTDRLIKLVDQFGSNGIAFWGINSNKTEPTEDVMNHAASLKYNFPVLKDVNNIVADQFSAQRTPEVFVVDSDMKLIYHGRIDDNRDENKVSSNDLSNALNEFLAGKEISVSETKAFGCSIKR